MKIHNFKKERSHSNPHRLDAIKLYDETAAVVVHLKLKAGESLKPHITPVDVAFYILQGEPTILIGDEKQQVTRDDLIESPKNIVHCIYNYTNEVARILIMKFPKPQAKTKFVDIVEDKK